MNAKQASLGEAGLRSNRANGLWIDASIFGFSKFSEFFFFDFFDFLN